MAVVSEPPWLNRVSGTTVASGTTAVFPFGFTASLGSFLVLVVGGAVTHTNTGWTEQLSPVTSGELSVFTKTSDGTESSFTDTVNGANYPVVCIIYEFPTGTTWTAGASNANIALSSFQQVTGLPGTAQTVFGAQGEVVVTDGGGLSSTWSNPWTKDGDFTYNTNVNVGNDGYSIVVGHQINVTTTTATPAATVTRTGTAGADRQAVTWALNVAILLAAPTVNAGGDRYLALGATLDRTAATAANGATITAQDWSLISGTGSPATLSSSADLSWTPTSLGTYGLRFSATNSQGTTTQDITVTVVDGVWHKDAMIDMYEMGRF